MSGCSSREPQPGMDWGGNYEGGPHTAPWLGGGGLVPGGSDGHAGADASAEGPGRAPRCGRCSPGSARRLGRVRAWAAPAERPPIC